MEPQGADPAAPRMPRTAAAEDRAPAPAWESDPESPAETRWRYSRLVGRYEDFLRCSVDWLWETDAELVLTYVSTPVALKLGLPAQLLIGRRLPSLGRFEMPVGSQAETEAPSPLAVPRPFRNAAFVMTGAEGREVPYLLSGVPYYNDGDGRFAGYRGTALAGPPEPAAPADAQDYAALNRALEEALLRNADLSWRLSQLEGTPAPAPSATAPAPAAPAPAAPAPAAPAPPPATAPLSRTAHELRTPLNAVIGYADLGLSQVFGPLGERYQDCFRSIREAGRHMDQVVAQLQVSAKQPGRAAPAREVVEIAGVVAKAKAMIALAARDAEVDLSRVGPMAGGQVLGNAQACTQILLNLFSNAVKFTPAGGSIGLETVVGPNNTLQIVVWDSGLGIAPEALQRIFEPDYSTEPVRPLGGILSQGLGLAISRDLARSMGGELSVISQPGQGSRFILSLPLAAPAP